MQYQPPPQHTIVADIALMSSLQEYFEYVSSILCGIPRYVLSIDCGIRRYVLSIECGIPRYTYRSSMLGGS